MPANRPRHSLNIVFRVQPYQRAALLSACAASGECLSDFLRRVALEAARASVEPEHGATCVSASRKQPDGNGADEWLTQQQSRDNDLIDRIQESLASEVE